MLNREEDIHVLSNRWSLSSKDLARALAVDPALGLSKEQVETNRHDFGSNRLEETKLTPIWHLILEGFKEPMMVLLLTIAALSLLFGKEVEAAVMLFVVMAYVFVEFVNKYRSDRILTRLRELTQPTTKVVREGNLIEINIADVVVGDVVLLTEGSRIPADIKLSEAFGLLVDESALTGESLSKPKSALRSLDTTLPPLEQPNNAFSGSVVVAGEGRGIVVAVGKETELGGIASSVQEQKKERTPTQDAMARLAKTLAVVALVVSALIPLVGVLRGLDSHQMILTWLALTFLMIPGQPPVIITMALALASFDLSRNKLVVKRLRGVEALGQITCILTDKTGTLTENKMTVAYFVAEKGEVFPVQGLPHALRERLSLCLPSYLKDPTDAAMRQALGPRTLEKPYTQLQSFSDAHPWRELTYEDGSVVQKAISGQPEALINASSLQQSQRERLLAVVQREAGQGNRVVAFALQQEPSAPLEFLALAVLQDPIRPGTAQAVQKLEQAGITTFLVTGDHPATAQTIANEVGLKGPLLTGKEMEGMTDDSLFARLASVKTFARMTPSQKLRLVKILQAKGENVAVIGDGVNDAPALKAATTGIAMGEIGTDLAREAADVILTDDNYIHLPEAIATGRKALDNFRKGLTYYLTAKAILLFIFLVPLILAIPFPLAPIHILLTELLMDLASSTIFVTEEAEPDVMKQPSRSIKTFLDATLFFKIAKNGTWLALGILGLYLWVYYSTQNVVLSQTVAFVSWLLGHILLAINLKQERRSLWKRGVFANRFATGWLIGMGLLSLLLTYVPALYPLFHTTALTGHLWLSILLVVFASTFWIEVLRFH